MKIKLWIKILIIVFVILALFFSAAYIFLALKGKAIVIKQLEQKLKRPVSIASLSIAPPLNVEMNNLEIKGLLKADSVYIAPSVLDLLFGRLTFNEIRILKPKVTYEKIPSGQIAKSESPEASPVIQPERSPLAEALSAITEGDKNKAANEIISDVAGIVMGSTSGRNTSAETPASPAAPEQSGPQGEPLSLIFKHIAVKGGEVDFFDRDAGTNGIKIIVKDINFHINNLYLMPRSVATHFELRGRIPWQEGQEEGKLEAAGWINFYKKDMQVTVKLQDIDGVYLYPYYAQWVDLEKMRIQKAKLNFSSNIEGVNNDITAKCHLELTDIVRTPRDNGEPQEKAEKITNVVLDIFRALNQGKIDLDFTIHTKMDRPEFGFNAIKAAFEDKIAKGREGAFGPDDVLKAPGKVLEGTVKTALDLSRAMIDGVFAIGSVIKDTTGDSFRREPEEEGSSN